MQRDRVDGHRQAIDALTEAPGTTIAELRTLTAQLSGLDALRERLRASRMDLTAFSGIAAHDQRSGPQGGVPRALDGRPRARPRCAMVPSYMGEESVTSNPIQVRGTWGNA